jgi:quercetin dioxygenase-like cupin family protein
MEFLTEADFVRLENPGVVSEQLLSPHNSASTRITITRVTIAPGSSQPRHKHVSSEQIWIALDGSGELKLAKNRTRSFMAGQVARFADGDVHGLANTGVVPFIYPSVTAPPINFDYAYGKRLRTRRKDSSCNTPISWTSNLLHSGLRHWPSARSRPSLVAASAASAQYPMPPVPRRNGMTRFREGSPWPNG